MTTFRRILSLTHAFQFIRTNTINASCAKLGANNNFSRIRLIQSRCLFMKKSLQDSETKDEIKKPNLFELQYLEKNNKLDSQNYSLSNLTKKIQDEPLDEKSLNSHLFFMLKVHKLNRFSPEFSTEMDAFVKSEEFEQFAQNLEKSLPSASTQHLCLMFEAMHMYQIPCSSILLQKLHALILNNINKFTLVEVIRMYLITKNNNDNLLEPVKTALLAYMNYLSAEDLKHRSDFKQMAYFAAKEEVPFSVREKIVKKVVSLGYQISDLSPSTLTWLSFPLFSEEFRSLDKQYYLSALERTLRSFEYGNLKTLLQNISNGIRKKVIYHDELLLNLIARCACKYDLWMAHSIMNSLLKISHVNYSLANAIADKLMKGDMESLRPKKREDMLLNFGSIDYRNYLLKNDSEKWSELKKVLLDYIESGPDFKYLETYLSLFILHLDSKELIGKALIKVSEALESNEEVPKVLLKNASLLYQCHCAVYSSPPENVSEKILSNCFSEVNFSPSKVWKEAVYESFQGEEYVLEKCKTPFGVPVSYVAILGPDQNPINLSAYKKPKSQDSCSSEDFVEIEKITRPAGSKVFAFIEYSQEPIKFRNAPLLKLKPRLINTIHKNLGYRIYHLHTSQKKHDDDYKKVLNKILARDLSYIASKIESRTPEISGPV